MGEKSTADRQGGARRGQFANGIEYLAVGEGPRNILWLQGGPGSSLPTGWLLSGSVRRWRAFRSAGFTVWLLTRRRGMPAGHTVADMAEDLAQVISEEFGGRVDLVVGESYGGMIAQCLAAEHPALVGKVVLSSAAHEVTPLVKAVDLRLAEGLSGGDKRQVGEAMLSYLMPSDRARVLRKGLAPLFGALVGLVGEDASGRDPLVEGLAEQVFDSSDILPKISLPVLVLAGDRDLAFSQEAYRRTAQLIPHCTLIWYEGKGHLRAVASRRVAQDVIAFANGLL